MIFFLRRDGAFAFKYTKKRSAEDILAFMKKWVQWRVEYNHFPIVVI